MKTYNEWQESSLDLEDFLNSYCEIDEELWLYIGDCSPAQFLSREFIQMGEAIGKDENEVLTYITTQRVGDKYFYLGVLPEFKQ